VGIAGRIALVTGGGSGIGAGICDRLAQGWASVAVLDLDLDAARRQADQITAGGGEATAYGVDVNDPEAVADVVAQIGSAHGRIDICVNNAGIIHDAQPIEDTPVESWDAVVDVNVRSQFLVARAVVPWMKRNGYGRIVNLASRRWLGGAGLSSYAASKGAVISLTRSLALELGPFGITANAVSPSLVVTPLFMAMPPDERDEVLARVARQPIPRPGQPSDIANAVVFFAADESDYVTGQHLYVAGGQDLGSSGVT
jgi:NAD(P)-dependent dehydrogenase (short-subunit alcohol dehydrogenase family)